jgi:hypothetical protein
MKTNFILILFVFCLANFALCQNNIAVVNKIQGFYIFIDSQPLGEYEVIGEVTSSGHNDRDISNSGGQYQPVRDHLIRTARQTNYQADGLILTLVNGGTDKAVIIKFKESEPNKNLARVTQYQGLFLFVDCEPKSESNYLGTIKSKMSFSSAQYSALRDKLIKKCKKSFPSANGLIIKFVSGGVDTGDAVIFSK